MNGRMKRRSPVNKFMKYMPIISTWNIILFRKSTLQFTRGSENTCYPSIRLTNMLFGQYFTYACGARQWMCVTCVRWNEKNKDQNESESCDNNCNYVIPARALSMNTTNETHHNYYSTIQKYEDNLGSDWPIFNRKPAKQRIMLNAVVNLYEMRRIRKISYNYESNLKNLKKGSQEYENV